MRRHAQPVNTRVDWLCVRRHKCSMASAPPLSLASLQAYVRATSDPLDDGLPLDALDEALIDLGVRSSVTALNRASAEVAIAHAFSQGATVEQVQEVVTLVSGLGVHSLMITAPLILEQAKARMLVEEDALDAGQEKLWAHYVGDQPYWQRFDEVQPGFLRSLLFLSPAVFAGFFEYCAPPWVTRSLPARTTELIALATDVTPSHVFPTGAALHLANAVKLGAGRLAIERTLELAAACPIPGTN